MPRGRHRHSPPLHRLLPPSAIAGVSLVCAVGPWLFTEQLVLRGLAAGAAATAVVGAVVMRRWDTAAGKRVADLTRARASDEWRHEERVAELETDLEESRELRTKLEHKLRAKRAELQGLRNEHAALLRRYATAETERASALEGRRLLEIEAAAPARALPVAAGEEDAPAAEAPMADAAARVSASVAEVVAAEAEAGAVADDARGSDDESAVDETVTDESVAEAVVESEGAESASETSETSETSGDSETSEAAVAADAPEVFSPAGSSLFLRASSALERLTKERAESESADSEDGAAAERAEQTDSAEQADSAEETDSAGQADSAEETDSAGQADSVEETAPEAEALPAEETDAVAKAEPAKAESTEDGAAPETEPATDAPATEAPATDATDAPAPRTPRRTAIVKQRGPAKPGTPKSPAPHGGSVQEAGQEDEAEGKPEAVDGHERAAAVPAPETPAAQGTEPTAAPAATARAAKPGPASHASQPTHPKPTPPTKPSKRKPAQPTGHFTVPTAVAVVPASPRRRPAVEGGFDFFGTQKGSSPEALEAVQNEDLADVVGQEALALHKAEAEAGFKPADEESRGIGQVIDLTAHDETEQIDVQGLRSAVS